MRFLVGAALCLSAITAQAASLDVSVVEGVKEPQKFRFELKDQREQVDLRESHSYPAAFTDPKTKKNICRDGIYHTGLLLTLRPIGELAEDGTQSMEIVGQVTALAELKKGVALDCGTDHRPEIKNTAFSDTAKLTKNRSKVIIIDGQYTVLLTLR